MLIIQYRKLDALEKEIRELRSSIVNTPSTGAQTARDEQATNAPKAHNSGAETFQSGNHLFFGPSVAPFDEILDSRHMDTGAQKHESAISLNDIILEPDKVTKLFHM